jgi:heat shock protein HspQ
VSKDPQFSAGDLITHRRYGYRGVVAAGDPECKADDDWYFRNRTQPVREQPWYHVLVHGGRHTTYVAEENLTRYEGGEQVSHPLVKEIFSSFSGGRYHLREGVHFHSE